VAPPVHRIKKPKRSVFFLILLSHCAYVTLVLDAYEKQHSVELPPGFSRATSAPLSYHFKIVCQLFVILARDLVEDRQITMESAMKGGCTMTSPSTFMRILIVFLDPYFLIAMQKVRGALSGLQNSLVRSQVWRPAFTHALQTYPILDLTELHNTTDNCAACHLPDRRASRLAIFSGVAYDKVTFEVRTPSNSEAFLFV